MVFAVNAPANSLESFQAFQALAISTNGRGSGVTMETITTEPFVTSLDSYLYPATAATIYSLEL